MAGLAGAAASNRPNERTVPLPAPVPTEEVESAHGHVLPVPFYKQLRGTLCYAAITQSLIDYYTREKVNQFELAERIKAMDKTPPKKGQNPELAEPFPFLEANDYVKLSYFGMPPWDTIKAEIDAGRPLIAMVGIHYILIIGYNGTSKGDRTRTLTFIDPLVGVETLRASNALGDTEDHYDGGFPTGGEAASKGVTILKKSDIKRERFIGHIPTKAPEKPAAEGAAAKGATAKGATAKKRGRRNRRVTRRSRH